MSTASEAMLADLCEQQRDLVLDPHPWVSVCGARRAGKTTAMVTKILVQGEERPGHMTIMGAPEKQWLRDVYWGDPDSGIPAVAARYGLRLTTKENELTWRHPNGSHGILMGMKGQKEVEAWMGKEANLYGLDEMHRLREDLYALALDKIIGPQAISRRAQVLTLGNPGDVCAGYFWKATDPGPEAREAGGQCVPWRDVPALDPDARAAAWSFHHLSMQGNTALPHQWEDALSLKRRNGWADDHPIWVQQYLGLWVRNPEALRFNFQGKPVTWTPRGDGLTSLGLWLTEDQAFLVLLSYEVETGRITLAHETTCDGSPESVVKAYRLATGEETPAWAAAGGPGMSDFLFDWFAQAGIPLSRYRRVDRPALISTVNGAVTSGRLSVPARSALGVAMTVARKKEETPGTEYTDALLVAVGQLPAPPFEDPAPPPPPLQDNPWHPAYLPPRTASTEVEPEGTTPETWADFLGRAR